MGFRGSCSGGGEGDGAEKEGLVRLGRELHSRAVHATFARIFTGIGGFLGKLLSAGGRRREIEAPAGK